LNSIHDTVFNATARDQGLFRMNGTTYFRSDREELIWAHTPKLYALKDNRRSLLPKKRVMKVLFPATSGAAA